MKKLFVLIVLLVLVSGCIQQETGTNDTLDQDENLTVDREDLMGPGYVEGEPSEGALETLNE